MWGSILWVGISDPILQEAWGTNISANLKYLSLMWKNCYLLTWPYSPTWPPHPGLWDWLWGSGARKPLVWETRHKSAPPRAFPGRPQQFPQVHSPTPSGGTPRWWGPQVFDSSSPGRCARTKAHGWDHGADGSSFPLRASAWVSWFLPTQRHTPSSPQTRGGGQHEALELSLSRLTQSAFSPAHDAQRACMCMHTRRRHTCVYCCYLFTLGCTGSPLLPVGFL